MVRMGWGVYAITGCSTRVVAADIIGLAMIWCTLHFFGGGKRTRRSESNIVELHYKLKFHFDSRFAKRGGPNINETYRDHKKRSISGFVV
jgi:hypothetical protein